MTKTALIIAISGGSGSGKSTLADALLEHLGTDKAVRLDEDGYYHPLSHYGTVTGPQERAALTASINYDDPASKDTHALAEDLRRLRSGQGIDQPIYDFAAHDRLADRTTRIDPREIIIIEGIHVLCVPDIRDMVDLSIYVDTPDDLRLARRLRRDVQERGRNIEDVLSQYLGSVRPAHYAFTFPTKFAADLVIADEGLPAYGNVSPTPRAIARMTSPVLERLRALGAL